MRHIIINTVTLFSILMLTSCGFQPLYGNGQTDNYINNHVVLAPIAGTVHKRFKQQLMNYLIDQGMSHDHSGDTDYNQLSLVLAINYSDIGHSRDDGSLRQLLFATISGELQKTSADNGAEPEIKTIKVQRRVYYSSEGSPHAIEVSRKEATETALSSLAKELATRVRVLTKQ